MNLLRRFFRTGLLGLSSAIDAVPETPIVEAPPPACATADVETFEEMTVRREFNPAFYLRTYEDVAVAGIDPVRHYCSDGWREGRDPSPDFETVYYLESNPDVASAGMNPFYHYLVAGRAEGRVSSRRYRWMRDVVMAVRERPLMPTPWTDPNSQMNLAEFSLAIQRLVPNKPDKLVVSFSHDRYLEVVGGVQIRIADEQCEIMAAGGAYLHVAPVQPLAVLSPYTSFADLGYDATVNGQPVGRIFGATLEAWLLGRQAAPGSHETRFVIHHLMGHSPEAIAKLANALDAPVDYWVHDFFLLCESFPLLRNGVTFCSAPPPDSQACQVCVSGPRRKAHAARMNAFLSAVDLRYIVPSQPVLEFLRGTGLSIERARVAPHGDLHLTQERSRLIEPERPLRIAFAGLPAIHKGWPAFVELARRLRGRPEFAFYHLGSINSGLVDAMFVPVSVTQSDRDAMARALTEHDIDIVLHWTLCFETFSFVTHEAIAAGAFILVPEWAGNAAAVVRDFGSGMVLPDLPALFELFETGAITSIYRDARENGVRRGTFTVERFPLSPVVTPELVA